MWRRCCQSNYNSLIYEPFQWLHTISCRSESSNISLVVLDKDALCPNANHGRLKCWIHFQREPPELVKLLHLSPLVTLSGQRPTCPGPRTWRVSAFQSEKSRNTETSASSVPTTAGHLSGEILTKSQSDTQKVGPMFAFLSPNDKSDKKKLNFEADSHQS